MKYVDELMVLYAGKDAHTRKFLLGQLLDHVPDLWSSEPLELLCREMQSPDALVRRQARYVLGQVAPLYAEQRRGLAAAVTGVWTNYARLERDGVVAAPRPAEPGGGEGAVAALVRAAGHRLEAPLKRLQRVLAEGAPEARIGASLVLGRFPRKSTLHALAAAVTAEQPSFAAAFALGDLGGEEAERSLLAAARAHAAAKPDLLALLRGFPGPDTLACLTELEGRVDAAGRVNVAAALALQPFAAARPLLERLIRRREGWVTAQALDTLGGTGDPAALELIRLGWELEPHEFVRAQAVRAAGALASGAAADFCVDRLREPSGRIQSLALEAVARQGLKPTELMELARPLLASDFLRTRVHAILITALAEPEAARDALGQLLGSDEALLRAEAAYLLGYLPPAEARGLLERMAADDPAPAVRVQAVKSVLHLPPDDALPSLFALLAAPDPGTAAAAARACAGLPATASGVVIRELSKRWEEAAAPSVRAAILRALGLAAAQGEKPAPDPLAAALGADAPEIVLAALDGACCLGDGMPLDSVRRLARGGRPEVRAHASLVACLGGDVDRADAFDEMLAGGDPVQQAGAIDALIGLGELLPLVPRAPRYAGLVKSLREHMRGEAYQEFARVEIDLATRWVPPTGSLRPNAVRVAAAPERSAPRAASPAAADRLAKAYNPVKPPPRPSGQRSLPTAAPAAASPARAVPPALLAGFAVAAALGLALYGLSGGRPAPPAARLERDALQLVRASGACTARSGGGVQPLAAGDRVRPPCELATGEDGSLAVLDVAGNSVTLGPVSSLRVEKIEVGAGPARQVRWLLAAPRGACTLDLQRAFEAQVDLGGATLSLSAGAVRVTDVVGGQQLELSAGTASLFHPGAAPQPLAVGAPVKVPR